MTAKTASALMSALLAACLFPASAIAYGDPGISAGASSQLQTSAQKKQLSKTKVSVASLAEYTGKAVTPKVTVKDGAVTLKAGKSYNVSYSDSKGKKVSAPKEAGTYKVTVKGKGGYTGSVVKKVKVVKVPAMVESPYATTTINQSIVTTSSISDESSTDLSSTSVKRELSYTLDKKGNAKRLDSTTTYTNEAGNEVVHADYCDFTVNGKGYVTGMSSRWHRADGTTYPLSGSVKNTVDGLGRITKAVMTTSNGLKVTSTYTYYGYSRAVKTISSTGERAESWTRVNVPFDVEQIYETMPAQFTDSAAFLIVESGKRTTLEKYSKEGIRQSVSFDGQLPIETAGPKTIAKRNGKTYSRSSETADGRASTLEKKWDANACQIENYSYLGPSATTATWVSNKTEWSYKSVKSPSMATRILGRLR